MSLLLIMKSKKNKAEYFSHNVKSLPAGDSSVIRRLCIAVLIIFSLNMTVYSIEGPASPSVPRVEDPAHQEQAFRATVVFAHGGQSDGLIYLPFKKIAITVEREGTLIMMTEEIASISEIAFCRWKGTGKGLGGYLFNTVSVELILNRDKEKILAQRIPAFDRFTFETSKGKRVCYTYYYDYYINGVWKNSGSTEKDYPETKPHPDTVVKIIFNRTGNEGPVGELLKFLSK